MNAKILGQSSRQSSCSREEGGPTSTDFTCAKQITVQTASSQTATAVVEIKTQPESHTKRRIIPGERFCSPGALYVQTKTAVISLAPPNSQQCFLT